MKRGFWAGSLDYVRRFWYLALWPVVQKLFDWIVGDAVVSQLKIRAQEIHLPDAMLWLFGVCSKYPARSSFVIMCLVVSISAILAAAKESDQVKDTQPPISSPKIPEGAPTRETARLDFEQVSNLKVGQEGALGTWQEIAAAPNRGIVAVFRNTPADIGSQTPTARSVYAHMVFKNPEHRDEEVVHVSYGTWLDEYVNHVTFLPGQTRRLIVAIKINQSPVAALENSATENPFASGRFRRYAPRIRQPERKTLLWSRGNLEITIVDTSRVTVFHGFFTFDFEGDIWTLTPAHSLG
jgi:hypothetical protein